MTSESKEVDYPTKVENRNLPANALTGDAQPEDESSGEDVEEEVAAASGEGASKSKKKKKKKAKKKKKIAVDVGGEGSGSAGGVAAPKKITQEQLDLLLDANPALKNEIKGMSTEEFEKMMGRMTIADLLTGVNVGGRNQKDMASYKFWQTQPVPRLDDNHTQVVEGPIKQIDVDKVPKEPGPLIDGFEWVLMDVTDQKELEEVFNLLSNHYVEDGEAMFRFRYSSSFLHWALMAPGWRREWHIGVRASESRKLVAFISGIPVSLRVRQNVIQCSEINFLCVHRKLRNKRLAPVLIKEVTRRCYLNGIFQAIYTAGTVLPTPVASCRYFHRSLDWEKLYGVGFSPLPPGSTKQRQISKFKLPTKTAVPGLRLMEKKDVKQVTNLLKRYLERFDIYQVYTEDEVAHWLLSDESLSEDDRVVWTYVVEDGQTKKLTDFFSFYRLVSSVVKDAKDRVVNAAYGFYYATEAAWSGQQDALKKRLNELMHDALILAKQKNFDVFNALTLLDNPLFLEEQKFGAGDGQLHYYLYNYRTSMIAGGVNQRNQVDDRFMGGVGVIML